MRKKSVELLNANNDLQKSALIIQQLEKILEKKLPLEIKLFLKFFKTGHNNTTSEMGNAKRSFDGVRIDITSIEFLDAKKNCKFSHFYDLENLPELWETSIKDNPYFHQHSLLPIGFIEITNDFIFFSNKDGTIWRSIQDKSKLYYSEYLADNIFSFISKLSETEITDQEFIDKKIIKNWGEDFWRVKEENE